MRNSIRLRAHGPVVSLAVALAILRGSSSCSEGDPASPRVPDAPHVQTDQETDATAPEASDVALDEGPACTIQLPDCPASPPSWSGQVRSIVNSSCGGCHEDGGVEQSVFDFSTYADVHKVFGSMLDQVYGCIMPPADAAALTSADTQTLLEWLVCGAPDN